VNLVEYYKRFGCIEVDRQGDQVRMVMPLRRSHHTRPPTQRGDPVAASDGNGSSSPATTGSNGDVPLRQLTFLSRDQQASLRGAGIDNISGFLERAASARGRRALAEEVGIAEETLRSAAHLAEITRTGLPVQYLGRLKQVNVRTLTALQSLPPEELRRCLPERVATDELEQWRQRAWGLESQVED
jgi:hypothetical protein